jgi:hypothetical protein
MVLGSFIVFKSIFAMTMKKKRHTIHAAMARKKHKLHVTMVRRCP